MGVNTEELLAKAQKPSEDAMKLHPFYKGKVKVAAKACIRDFDDFAIWYTPGVAAPCKDIAANPEKVFVHTNKSNFVAVVSDGTRVLGLGDIGPEAAIPVMEGKAILFKYLGGVDAFPICVDTKDPDEIIDLVLKIQPVFGGVNLEDISQPKCFHILDTLREKARIPVWHDDQQGTAAVTCAGLINALRLVNKKIDGVKVIMIGAGASNIAIARVLVSAGIEIGNIVMYDSKGPLHKGRDDIINDPHWKEKAYYCKASNKWGITDSPDEGAKGADVMIALSKSEPGTVKKEWISAMADDAVVFTCANPLPEIWPWEAKEAGARIVATGRSDFPNQVNNSLGFPGIFRGTLDVHARTITDEMCIAAAYALADHAYEQKDKFGENYLIPTMDDWEIYPKEATAVGLKAIEQGVARLKFDRDELFQIAARTIKQARDETQLMMDKGYIQLPPKDL
jgi:malate dehydrogenase (oxaloacetate-decarboxylating)